MPMWSSVANLKESLSKIALEVHDDDDDDDVAEFSIGTSQSSDRLENGSSRRLSRNFNRESTPTQSPINGFDLSYNREIEQYKTEIKRLQESEAEIKKLSVNYAALLKEKEDKVLRLTEENCSLKQNLLTTNAALSTSKNVLKGNGDISPNRQHKASGKIRTTGSQQTNGIVPKHDGLSNGTTLGNTKEPSDAKEDKNRSLTRLQATHEAQMRGMTAELDQERDKLANMQMRLQEEQKLNGSLQQELSSLKDDNNKMLRELHKIRNDLNQKMSEMEMLQMELQRRGGEETVDNLKKVIATLEHENRNTKKEKDQLEVALDAIRSSPAPKGKPGDVVPSDNQFSRTNEAFPGKEDLQKSLQKLETDLKEALREKDKALQQLNRLKQHLLEKEAEESEKMDEDSKIIEELRETNEYQRAQISHLDKALKEAIGNQEVIKKSNSDEFKKAKEIIDDLNAKLTSCMNSIDAKNVEVLNLQTALGQYYAEIEAKERLGEELSMVKEESSRLSKQLKEAHEQVDASNREKEEILKKISQAERMLAEGKNRTKKLEEDNEKLRRALEQSMTRLNRMSVDSDFLVDRRIVIKLLVTYFQRNHSKEVLDLMVRMLGFSEEDKQRIGMAQQGAGKGVVRGVLGLPGRLVGGILGGSGSTEAHTAMASDNQSFADLWVDFLLTETEREKRESLEAANRSNTDQQKATPNATATPSPSADYRGTASTMPDIPRPSPYLYQNQMPSPSRGNFLRRDSSDSEFSTVPLTSSETHPQGSWQLPRY